MARQFGGEGRAPIERLVRGGHIKHRPLKSIKAAPPPPPIHDDPFSGTHSLASGRMHLVDLTERQFAPRNRDMAKHYRDALHAAPWRGEAMQKVSQAIIASVEVQAGGQRAASIREWLATSCCHKSCSLDRSGGVLHA